FCSSRLWSFAIYTFSLHEALPIFAWYVQGGNGYGDIYGVYVQFASVVVAGQDRKTHLWRLTQPHTGQLHYGGGYYSVYTGGYYRSDYLVSAETAQLEAGTENKMARGLETTQP